MGMGGNSVIESHPGDPQRQQGMPYNGVGRPPLNELGYNGLREHKYQPVVQSVSANSVTAYLIDSDNPDTETLIGTVDSATGLLDTPQTFGFTGSAGRTREIVFVLEKVKDTGLSEVVLTLVPSVSLVFTNSTGGIRTFAGECELSGLNPAFTGSITWNNRSATWYDRVFVEDPKWFAGDLSCRLPDATSFDIDTAAAFDISDAGVAAVNTGTPKFQFGPAGPSTFPGSEITAIYGWILTAVDSTCEGPSGFDTSGFDCEWTLHGWHLVSDL